ncbi:response regulator [Persicimonas caeni]|uniref:histidine kinase n=1 Tax=Persicimonas caeni TaxID=2292766 RepID=A0A4Y6PR54_PERCE|nr:response regulator [Persicimonas caeni]QDG50730.1 response regulator [Persicimonas caeni]QED31951.1 response regulator [Persicimonas caeni]
MNPSSTEQNQSSFFDLLTARFLPKDIEEGSDDIFRARVVVVFSLALAIWGPIYAAVMYALSGALAGPLAVIACAVFVCSSLFLLRRGVSFGIIGNWLAFNVFWIMLFVALVSDFGSPPFLWLAVVPMLAVLISGMRSGMVWLVLVVASAVSYYISQLQGGATGGALDARQQVFFELTVLVGLYVLVLSLTLAYESLKEWAIGQIRSREAHTQAVVQTAADGILTVSPRGRIRELNHAAEALFGFRRDDILDAPFATLVPQISDAPPQEEPDASEEADGADGELFATASPTTSEARIGGMDAWQGSGRETEGRQRGGSSVPIEMSISRIEGEDLDIDQGYVAIVRDITERKQNERALEEARDEAVRANEAKSAFLANISHELRTPLNAIIGYSELIYEDFEMDGHTEYLPDLKKIGVAGEHLLSLINDILDLSKIEAGKMELYLETIDLHSLLGDVADTIEPVVAKNDNTFLVDIDNAPKTMQGDITKLRQVLFNLLSNAAKFTENATVRLHAYADVDDGRNMCVFEVIDRGIGIPDEKLERLFQAFTQADESTTRQYGGTGLGLTITKHFTEMMGGRIEVQSEVGQGTTFRVLVPVNPQVSHSEPLDLGEDESSSAENDELMADPNSSEVLVIDDDPTVHALMKRFLNREGFAIRSANSGEEGLELARAHKPDAITLDVMMPEMDGWTVLSRLKGDAETSDIPVILLTIVSNKNMGYSLGASEYLVKPVDRKRLSTVLADVTGAKGEGRVLVVEDDESTREMLERTVARQGWQVDTAANGRLAIDHLESAPAPNVILLDLMMPEMDGFEVLETMRERPEWKDIPVVVVTAADLTVEERTRLNNQVNRILGKGAYTKDQLLAEVTRAVGSGAARHVSDEASANV